VLKGVPNAGADDDLNGQMAEVRLWAGERTAQQIRDNQFTRLTGTEDNLLALWNFADGTARDATGHGHDGTMRGNARVVSAQMPAQPSATPGEPVLVLDGNDSYVELPANIFSNLTEATVEAWVSCDTADYMRFFNAGPYNHDLGVGSRSDGLYFFVRDSDGGNFNLQIPASIKANDWNHIAAVSGPGGMRLYLNGVLVGTNAHTGSFSDTGGRAPNWIGRWPGSDQRFAGRIDELRVWSKQRSADEIRGTMLAKLTGAESGLVGLWNFDHVTNGLVKDLSSGGHDGVLKGNATVRADATLDVATRALPRGEQVLQLDGNDSYVVPANIFTNLTEATVEGWVKWDLPDKADGKDRMFFCFGSAEYAMFVGSHFGTPNAKFVIYDNRKARYGARGESDAPAMIQSGRWVHVAARRHETLLRWGLDLVWSLRGQLRTDAEFARELPGKKFLGRRHLPSRPDG